MRAAQGIARSGGDLAGALTHLTRLTRLEAFNCSTPGELPVNLVAVGLAYVPVRDAVSFRGLTRLRALRLQNTDLDALPPALATIRSLRQLEVDFPLDP